MGDNNGKVTPRPEGRRRPASTASPEPETDDPIKLRRKVTLLSASAIMTGCIIGSGIFVSPVSVIENCGSVGLSLIIWVVSGALSLGIVMCYAELGVLIPKAGAEYAFFKEILGPMPAFLTVWVQCVTVEPTYYAISALTASNYILKPFFSDCDVPVRALQLLSLWILITLTAVNSMGVKHVARVQVVFYFSKIAALVIIVVVGLLQLFKGQTDVLATGFEGTTRNPGGLATALVSGLFTYGGWSFLFNILEEIKRPEKVVPQASVISLTSVIVLYVLANVAYFTVLTPAEMSASSAVAVTFAERTLGPVSAFIPVLVALSAIGALNGAMLCSSRMNFAAARDGMLPDVLATIHVKHRTPIPAIWFTGVLSAMYILAGDAIKLIEYLGFVDTFTFGMAMCCVIILRIREPNLDRPIKVPLFVPVVGILMMVLAFSLGLYQEPARNGIGLLVILSGLPVYAICVLWRDKPRVFRQIQRKVTVAVQKLTSVLPQD